MYDDKEPPLDYGDNLLTVDPLEGIKLELDQDEDNSVIEWFYEGKPLQYTKQVNESSYKKWKLDLTQLSTLCRLAERLLGDVNDKN